MKKIIVIGIIFLIIMSTFIIAKSNKIKFEIKSEKNVNKWIDGKNVLKELKYENNSNKKSYTTIDGLTIEHQTDGYKELSEIVNYHNKLKKEKN